MAKPQAIACGGMRRQAEWARSTARTSALLRGPDNKDKIPLAIQVFPLSDGFLKRRLPPNENTLNAR
jgi:hypothetical protein